MNQHSLDSGLHQFPCSRLRFDRIHNRPEVRGLRPTFKNRYTKLGERKSSNPEPKLIRDMMQSKFKYRAR